MGATPFCWMKKETHDELAAARGELGLDAPIWNDKLNEYAKANGLMPMAIPLYLSAQAAPIAPMQSAAPELYEALSAIIRALKSEQMPTGTMGEKISLFDALDECAFSCVIAAEQALAKARGEAS